MSGTPPRFHPARELASDRIAMELHRANWEIVSTSLAIRRHYQAGTADFQAGEIARLRREIATWQARHARLSTQYQNVVEREVESGR
ncbi:hypothetical protein PTMSG1_04575 [Pyrenophora teres f. maculata]|nr:hypothetical protein PTMSG1_04575 [Pyrenophora teres f. maculata]